MLPILPPLSNSVDWTSGEILAAGNGMPPKTTANGTICREMANRAALADARRNMLKTIEWIRIDTDQTEKPAMHGKNVAIRIKGFLKEYTIVSERELENDKFEFVLELPLTGPAGLIRYIVE